MRPTSATAAAVLRRSHRSVARLVVLDPVAFTILGTLSGEEGFLLEGQVSMVRSRMVRRTCEVTLANPDGDWTPADPGDWLGVNSLVRLDRGVYLDPSTVEWFTLGHFLLGRPRVVVDAAGATLVVSGEDRAKLLLRSRFTAPTTYPAGTRVADVIREEAEVAGMGTTRYRLDDGGKVLAVARTFEEDEARDAALRDLARDYGLEVYADADGYLALAAPPDPVTAPVAWDYAPGDTATLVGLTKEWTDDRLYNHVLVTGESSDPANPPVRAEVMDTNPASPAYVNGPLGDRLYRYTSAMVTTVAQAQEVATNLLAEVALIEEAISLGTVTNPALEPGDAITVQEPLSRTEGRYLVDEVEVPLGLGTQTLGTRVVRAFA